MARGNSFGGGEDPTCAPVPASHGVPSSYPSVLDSPYLTVEEALSYLRMDNLKYGNQMIQRLVLTGKLKAFRRGREYLFTKDQLDDYLRIG